VPENYEIKNHKEAGMKKFTAVLFSVIVLAFFSAMVMAQVGMGGYGKMGSGMGSGCMMMQRGGHPFGGMYSVKAILGMASELNITSDQFEKLKAIEKDSAKIPDMDAAMADMKDMKAELAKDSPDEAKIDEMMSKMAAKHQEMMKAKIHEMIAFKAVLTSDQRDIIKKKMEKMEKMESMNKK
jgi:Spy/CpxP family protein refolding chaperone